MPHYDFFSTPLKCFVLSNFGCNKQVIIIFHFKSSPMVYLLIWGGKRERCMYLFERVAGETDERWETEKERERNEGNMDWFTPIHSSTGCQTCNLGLRPDEIEPAILWCTGGYSTNWVTLLGLYYFCNKKK